MKTTSKPAILLMATIILSVLAISSIAAYAALVITSNSAAYTGVPAPNLVLTLSSPAPLVGSTETMTATLSTTTIAGTVIFYDGTTPLNINGIQTVNGVASLTITVADTNLHTITAKATLP